MGELYKLNFPNGKAYIGIAANGAMGRFCDHRYSATKSDQLLYRAWRKHGEPILKVLAVVEDAILHETEIKAIASYGTMAPGGYNMTLGGEGTLGWIPSLETRAKLRAASTGKGHSPETRAKLSAITKAMVVSLETRAKLSAAHKGRVVSPETRAKIGAASRNPSPETRAKMSAATKGRVASPETLAKMRTAGRNISPETRAKMRVAGMNRSPETRAKMRAAAKQRWDRHRVEMKKVQP